MTFRRGNILGKCGGYGKRSGAGDETTAPAGYCGEIGGGGGCSTCGGGGYCTITDPYGNTITQTFDELGRVKEVKDALGDTAKTEFDNLGRTLSTTDALNRTTLYRYHDSGRLKEVQEANGAITHFEYDWVGNKKTMTNPLGKVWSYDYDSNNQLITETDPLGNKTEYAYTSTGSLWIKRLPNGWVTKNVYQGRRLIEVRSLQNVTMEQAKDPAMMGTLESSFGYDNYGRRITAANSEVSLAYVYDNLNRLHQVSSNTLGQAITYGYDLNGNTTSMIGPKGETKYIFDAKNRLSKQTDPVAGTFDWTYNALDRRMTLKYPNNLTTYYDYDNAYRLKSLITKNTQGDIIDGYSYLMDSVGNRTSMTSLRDNQVTSYEYDATYRLTKATYPWTDFEEFTYDIAGNRTKLVNSAGTTDYIYDAGNRLEKEMDGAVQKVGYTWDNAGNMLTKDDLSGTSTYEWNYDSRLIRTTDQGQGTTDYAYDPFGIRVRLTVGGTTKRFLYSNEDIIAEYGGASEMYYVHGPLIDEPLAQLAGTTLSYMHRDGLGSMTAFSNPGGQLAGTGANTYQAFGKVHDQTGVSSRYGYTSRELDDSGMMYYRSRYYQPDLGRFLNQDFYQGNELIPPSLHRYTYTHNNPIKYIDFSGRNIGLLGVIVLLVVVFGLLWLLVRFIDRILHLKDMYFSALVYNADKQQFESQFGEYWPQFIEPNQHSELGKTLIEHKDVIKNEIKKKLLERWFTLFFGSAASLASDEWTTIATIVADQATGNEFSKAVSTFEMPEEVTLEEYMMD